ncbi:MAG: hypothetical protein BMS9Abin36_0062 [Gammaproteobacteria bacterium]|nr:MAG: hypothetical protein BMS9Abin36_0062 [Gammaproteobacteria bacterium]
MNLKIRHLLSVLFGLMVLNALGFIAWEASDLTATSRKADWLVQANRLADLVIKANSMQARERGLTNILIAHPEAVMDKMRVKMFELRVAGDVPYRQALTIAREIAGRDDSHPLTGGLKILAKRRAALENARMLADRIIDNKDISMGKETWVKTMDAFIESLAQVRRDAFDPVDEFDRAYRDNLQAKEIVFSVSDHAGRERAIIGAAIAEGRPMSMDDRHKLLSYRAIVESELRQLASKVEETDRGPQLKKAMDRLNKEFLGRYQRLRAAVYTASEQRTAYPINAATWFTEATRGIDSILAVATAISRRTEQGTSAVQRQKIREAVLLIALISIALVAVFATIMLVRRRIILPLQVLATASERITKGDLHQPLAISGNDEFSVLARSFEQMRCSLLSDITERERVEATLQESEARSRAIVETAVDGIITIDESGFIDTFNPAAEKIFGYRADELVGRNVTILMPAAYRNDHQNGLTRYLRTGKARILGRDKIEVAGLRKDGAEFPMELSISAMHVRENRHFTGIMRDISERKQAQATLRLSEERFALVARGTQDGLWDWDLVTGQVYFSPRWKEMLGYGEAEIANDFAALQDLIHADDLGVALEAWLDCMEGKTDTFSVEYRLRDKQGGYRWIQCRGMSVGEGEGEPVRMAGSHTDISERRQAQEQLQKTSVRLQYLMDNSPAVIYSAVASGDFRITSVSENVTRLLGYTPAEMQADQNFWHDHIHPDDTKPVFSKLFTLFLDMEQTHEYRFRRKDGSYCWIHDTLRVSSNADGEALEVLGSLMDITERKHMENRLQAEKDEQQVLIQKLQEAQEQLLQSEKLASIGQLAAGVAHEINNPVGYIYSNLSTLQGYTGKLIEMLNLYEVIEPSSSVDSTIRDQLATKKEELELDYLKEDVQDLVTESLEGINRVKQIVQDLKDFSHVDQAEWQWTDLHRGLDSTLNIVNNEIKYKAEVVKEYGELPLVECLASQLNQVFMNLLVNAAHAIEQRGTITIRTNTEGEWVWVEISDTGKGIDAEHLKRIFDPFFTTKPVGTGTGLGLSLSYGIVNKHGGRIEVDSEPGKGTTFRVWLPVGQAQDSGNDQQQDSPQQTPETNDAESADQATKVEHLKRMHR